MSITGYKRLSLALACVCLCLVLALVYEVRKYAALRSEFRYAHNIVWSFERNRDFALKGDVTNAVELLYKLQAPTRPFQHPAAQFVERERRRAASDVIAYLRLKTGKDLGNEPEPWILAYGNDSLKMNQGAREELSREIEEVSKGNYGKLVEQWRTNK